MINFLYCLYLNATNKTLGDYTKQGTPLIGNIFFAGLAGAIWCSQFICFKTGEPAMGKTAYIGWAVLMASAILFSTLLGILLGEWKGTSARTRTQPGGRSCPTDRFHGGGRLQRLPQGWLDTAAGLQQFDKTINSNARDGVLPWDRRQPARDGTSAVSSRMEGGMDSVCFRRLSR